MKLLKYVMTSDSGLAPNPYFGICSLAMCTPNHMNANLKPGDWIVGHSCKASGRRLVYAMRLTKVLGMDEYFRNFPDKHPDPRGSIEQQYGDNMYFREAGRWARLPSAEHNCVESFRQDQGRQVFLAERPDSFWYFGASNRMPELQGFADRFPWLIQDRQGFRYIHDAERIRAFSGWLSSLEQSGLLGKPRDQRPMMETRYLTAIDPEPVWIDGESGETGGRSAVSPSTCSKTRPRGDKRSC
ncbi:hypothetical protein [Burkholderia ubonensis]|uniref:Nmad2 family putative nucleotide modification protein n=1 Tax=Burkholderia ubonensis TaxID=101571 RepID=UPI000AF205CB|nr:hypothetical protein [Burkholderia ubonensis]